MQFVVALLDKLHWWASKGVLRLAGGMALRGSTRQPETVVVLRNCFFGDFVVAIPALRKLRSAFPTARIVFLTATSFAPGWRDRPQDNAVFEIEPGLIDEVVRYTSEDLRGPAKWAALKARIDCRGPAVSLALCYSADSLRSRLKRIVFCRLLGLPSPLGLTGVPTLPAQHLLNRWRVGRTDIAHQYQSALGSLNEMLRVLNVAVAAPPALRQRKAMMAPLIGVAPFSKQSVKQWPLARFAELMARLAEETGAHFEVYGAPGERDMAVQLGMMLKGRASVSSLCGDLSAVDLRRRLEVVDLLICLDSGPMHLASLLGTPVVAIFSQITLHNFWKPWGPGGSLVSTTVPCGQCDTRNGECPLGTRACIDGIAVDTVLQQVRLTLGHEVHERQEVAV